MNHFRVMRSIIREAIKNGKAWAISRLKCQYTDVDGYHRELRVIDLKDGKLGSILYTYKYFHYGV